MKIVFFIVSTISLFSLTGCLPTGNPNLSNRAQPSESAIKLQSNNLNPTMYMAVSSNNLKQGDKVSVLDVKGNMAVTDNGTIAIAHLQVAPFLVDGTITWSDKAESIQKAFVDDLLAKSGSIKRNGNSFWQDTADVSNKNLGPLEAVDYCRDLTIDIDGVKIGGFRLPTKEEMQSAQNVKFTHVTREEFGDYWIAGGTKISFDRNGHVKNSWSLVFHRSGSSSTDDANHVFPARCVSDRLTFDHATIYDIASFYSDKPETYLGALEKAVNIKYGKSRISKIRNGNGNVSLQVFSREFKTLPFKTISDIVTFINQQKNELLETVQSSDGLVTLIGVYNFNNETLLALRLNDGKSLDGFKPEKYNANYVIVADTNPWLKGAVISYPPSELQVYPYRDDAYVKELSTRDTLFISIPRVKSDVLSLPDGLFKTKDSSIKDIRLHPAGYSTADHDRRGIFPSDTLANFEFSGTSSSQVAMEYVDDFLEIIGDEHFSPEIRFEVTGSRIGSHEVVEARNYKHVVEQKYFLAATASTDALHAFIKKYPVSEFRADALEQLLNLTYNDAGKLADLTARYPQEHTLVTKAHERIAALKKQAENARLAAIELEKDNAYGDIIGPNMLDGAKFINGRIWQDQPENASSQSHTYKQAQEYCEKLDLLGVRGWRLPSKEDFERLSVDMTQLTYRARVEGRMSDYFTRDGGCSAGGIWSISEQECVYVADISANKNPYISRDKKSAANSARCVLSAYKYNKHQNALAASYVEKGGFQGYLDAFKASGNKEYVKQAYQYASSEHDKSEIALALIKHFGMDTVFESSGTLSGNADAGSQKVEVQKFIVSAISSKGKAEIDLKIDNRQESPVALKYGSYRLKVKVKLKLVYHLVAMGVGTTQTEYKEKEGWVTLSSQNRYTNTCRFDFGEILQDIRGSIGFSMSQQLQQVEPTITFETIELIK